MISVIIGATAAPVTHWWDSVWPLIVPTVSAVLSTGVAFYAVRMSREQAKRSEAIADAQAKVAAAKLRLDMFDKGFTIWKLIDDGIEEQSRIIMKQNPSDVLIGDFAIDGLQKIWKGKQEAGFMFGPEVLSQIEEVERALQDYQNKHVAFLNDPHGQRDREKSLAESASRRDLIKEQDWLTEVFKPYLDLSNARFGDAVDLSNRRKFRESIKGLGMSAKLSGLARPSQDT